MEMVEEAMEAVVEELVEEVVERAALVMKWRGRDGGEEWR